MINKNIITAILMIGIVFSMLNIGFVLAESTSTVCCEKTTTGAWCQNTQQENCDADFRVTPTSCEGTSFCKPGCCFGSQEGLCMENTPQRTCNNDGGTWVDDSECNVAQCELGCCGIGDQASFVTLTRCKRLASLYGLETNFRTDINDEISCIETAFAEERGACVFESEFEVTCRITTRNQCLNAQPGSTISTEKKGFFAGFFSNDEEVEEAVVSSKPEFYRDLLCSNNQLKTICGKSKKTMCVEGRDEVYFQDSCGNIANIYDANKVEDQAYWNEIVNKEKSCNPNSNNADSKDCGNCDYFGGSICAEGNAKFGKLACQDLSCEVDIYGQKETKQNGESWCIYDEVIGEGNDVVGSRHFRHVCINGEELTEPCDDFRAKTCIESESIAGDFTEAACRVNKWQDCMVQREEDDCMNTDKRDCYWLTGIVFPYTVAQTPTPATSGSGGLFGGGSGSLFGGGTTGNVVAPITGNALGSLLGGGEDTEGEDEEKPSGVQLGGGACVPNYPPGLRFWEDGDAQGICSLGNSVCIVQYEKGLLDGDAKCIDNCECLESGYAQTMNNACRRLGDCGAYVNIAGVGTSEGAEWIVDGDKQVVEGILNYYRRGA